MDAVFAAVGEQLEALTLAADGLTRVMGIATSDDGLITAKVSGDGTLTGLDLAEAITANPPEQAAAAITATIAAAHAEAARHRAILLARLGEALG